MPLHFLNGVNYAGSLVYTTQNVLDEISAALVAAGWINRGTSGTAVFFEGTSQTNNHKCFVEFSISTSYLHVRGYHDVTYSVPSPLSTSTGSSSGTYCRVSSGTENRLWVTANSDAGCICIIPSGGLPAQGIHFGFLDRVDPTDQWAWMVGNLVSDGLATAYSAKSKYDAVNWRNIDTDMAIASRQYGAYDAIWMLDQTGRYNYDGTHLVRPFFWLEGRVSTSSVSTSPNPPYFRGNVQYAYTGMANAAAGSYGIDPITGFRLMSTGDAGWQAMRIA